LSSSTSYSDDGGGNRGEEDDVDDNDKDMNECYGCGGSSTHFTRVFGEIERGCECYDEVFTNNLRWINALFNSLSEFRTRDGSTNPSKRLLPVQIPTCCYNHHLFSFPAGLMRNVTG
jgi:hypothetical protein